jgi:5-methylcytosine-specific restriction endonuclease McrA
MLRDSDMCELCNKRFRVGQSLDIIPLGDGTEEGERVSVYVHERCAAPYRQKEKKRKEDIRHLEEEMSRLDYLASAVWGRAHDSINCKALRRQRRLKRQLLELRQGPGWTADQWEALKRKYHHRCVCCLQEGLRLEPDHIDPIDKGGAHHISNIQPLCKPCNMKKGARHHDYRPDDARQWERDIRGFCRGGIYTTKLCNRLVVAGRMFCAVHLRERDREIKQLRSRKL